MRLSLSDPEIAVLREALESDIAALLMEIARAENRKMRENLRIREALLESILRKLSEEAREAA